VVILDWTEIITAAIAAVGAVAGSVLVQSKQLAVLQTKIEALKEDLASLSARVDKHNQLQDRMLRAECKLDEIEKERKK
jgi:uncharacterized protein YigA (DUF484 family)